MHGRTKTSAPTVQEMQSNTQARNAVADILVERWSKTKAGARLDETWDKNPNKARSAAMALNNQAKYLKRFDETSIKTQFNTVPENVLKIVRIGTANSNRGNIFHEWPLVTPDDAIYFVDRVYKTAEATAVTTESWPAAGGSTLRGGTPNDRIYETIAPDHATEQYTFTLGALSTGANAIATISPLPMVPMWSYLIVSGVVIARDNGAGGWTIDPRFATAINAADAALSTIDYAAGTGNIQVTNAALLPGAGAASVIAFSWDSEVDSNYDEYAKVDIVVSKKRFSARPQPLGYSYTQLVEITLESTGLGSVEEMLVRAVGDEHAMRRDFKAVQLAKRVALGNPLTIFDADYAGAASDNDYNHAQRILSTISDVSGEIFNDIGRGAVNRIVAGSRAVTYFKKHKLWETDGSQARVGGTYLAGKLDDIDVYACRANVSNNLVADNEAVLTYRNPDDDGDVGIAFGVMTELAAALDYPQFYREGNIATVEDSLVINPKFVRMLRIDNIS